MWESPRFSISLLLAWLSLATVLFDISGNPPFVRLPFDLLIFAYTFRCLDRFFSDRELSAGKLLFLELILVAWVSLAFLLDLLSRHPPEVQKAQVLYVLLHFYLYLKLQLLVWIQPVALGQTPQMEHPEYASGLYVPFAPRITDRKGRIIFDLNGYSDRELKLIRHQNFYNLECLTECFLFLGSRCIEFGQRQRHLGASGPETQLFENVVQTREKLHNMWCGMRDMEQQCQERLRGTSI